MKNLGHLFFLVFAFAVFSCISVKAQKNQPNTLSEAEKNEGWKLLFDGESLHNWKIFNGSDKITGWKIIDGALHNSGVGSDFGGDIITKEQFENFELYLEWKVAPESNSGIFFHVQEEVVQPIYESGPEYQLIDGKGWPTPIKPEQYSGANYAMHAPQGAEVKPLNEWNSSRIVVINPKVEHWLNGKKVVEYELWTDEWKELKARSKWANKPYYGAAKKGHIGLQDHGGLTMFRNIKIREIK